MTRNLAKLLDTIWTLSMGLFLGLTGGMVLAVILIEVAIVGVAAQSDIAVLSNNLNGILYDHRNWRLMVIRYVYVLRRRFVVLAIVSPCGAGNESCGKHR